MTKLQDLILKLENKHCDMLISELIEQIGISAPSYRSVRSGKPFGINIARKLSAYTSIPVKRLMYYQRTEVKEKK